MLLPTSSRLTTTTTELIDMAAKEETAAAKATPAVAADAEGKWTRWGRAGFTKTIKVSDWISPYANKVSSAVGGERFWPQSNDMVLEIEKAERILRAFTVEGIQQKEEKDELVKDEKGNWIKKKVRVLRKIPPAAIRNAKGIAIYSSMRSGIAPLGGGGGSGVFLARLPDGSWSAPSAISPQNGAVGLLLGVDFLDVILLINSEKSMATFNSHRVDIGAETGITAGPYGTGYSAEASYDKAPIYSYVRTRGMYAGAEVLAQIFFHRFDENERFYYWPGIKAGDILSGKIRVPPTVYPLHRALRDAESGRAQGGKLERTEYDLIKIPESEVFKQLGPNSSTQTQKRFVAGLSSSNISTPRTEKSAAAEEKERQSSEELDLEEAAINAQRKRDEEEGDQEGEEIVRDGERLRLPPTPAELEMMEAAGIPDEEDLRVEREDRVKVYALPAPPLHPDVVRHWEENPELAARRPRHQLVMDGPSPPELREAQFAPLPPSPDGSPKPQLKPFLPPPMRTGNRVTTSNSKHSVPPLPQVEGEVVEPSGGEVLAKGVDAKDADKVIEAAMQGDIEKAKEIGKEASETGNKEHTSIHTEGVSEKPVASENVKDEVIEQREVHEKAEEASRHDAEDDKAEKHISTSIATTSPSHSFASLESASKNDGADDAQSSSKGHVELPEAAEDAEVPESTSLEVMHTPALRADTPTNDTEITGPFTPPPADDDRQVDQNESGKLTPSRPPRRARPPKKR